MKLQKLITPILLALIVLAFFIPVPTGDHQAEMSYDEVLEGEIISTNENFAQVRFYSGSLESEITEIEMEETLSGKAYVVGNKVSVARYEEPISQENIFYILDHVRRTTIYWIFAAFIAIVVLATGWQGANALVGMAFSFLVIFKLILPLLISGFSPLMSAIIGASIIIPVTFTLSHGYNKKTLTAIIGTFITLFITGVISVVFSKAGNLSGLTSDEAIFLRSNLGDTINYSGLVLAGIIISVLGVLDDITIAQAGIVTQLKEAKSRISFTELYSRAMSIGKDHISSMVNTLVLVYAGASLPLLLLFIDQSHSISEVLNYEFLAEEIIKTLAGSISLVIAVPITTAIAIFMLKRKN